MKLLNIRLYEQAGDGGSGGGGGTGGGASGAASGDAAASASASLLSGGATSQTGSETSGSAVQSSSSSASTETSSTVGEAWHVGLYDASGKINPAKFDALPEHLKSHKDLFGRYQTVEALMGGLANMSSLAGKKALAPLPENATPEAKAERQKLMAQLNNVPEKPEGYGLKRPDNIPEGQWNQEYADGIAGILHKHAISPQAAKELMEFDALHASKIGETTQAQVQAAKQAEAKALKDAFGADYAKQVDLAVRGAKTVGLDPNDPIFGNHKVVVAMAKFASLVSEDRLISGESSANAGMDDRAKALDIVNNPSNPMYKAYHEADHPQHAQAVEAKSRFNQAYHAKMRPKA
jgi:hypothetical protein